MSGNARDSAAIWHRIDPLLDAALDLDTDERQRFVEQSCAGDAALLARLQTLLRAASSAGAFLELPATKMAAGLVEEIGRATPPAERCPPLDRVGAYRLINEIGRGGMGAVYVAERADEQYRQRVAVKLVRPGGAVPGLNARFRTERQILASLEHPNIARLHDGGMTADGTPYLVMEYIDGRRLDVYCAEEHLSITDRLKLFEAVCAAVQFAHQNLVVHRDLKPGNVLVTADGTVKLLDFGIARLLDADAAERSLPPTESRLMTPTYASPEQIRGGAITVSSDIYSLGVILYELLTGRTPFAREGRTPHELAQAILEEEPPLPSSVVPKASARRLRGDLDCIVASALRTGPREGYASAAALADDIRRYLDGRPVRARGATPLYRMRRLVRRHRLATIAASIALASLLLGLTAAVGQARRADRERDAARRETARAEQVAAFLASVFHLADPNVALGETVTIAAALDSAAIWLDRDLATAPETRADIAWTLGAIFGALGRSDTHRRLMDSVLVIQEREFGPHDPRLGRTLTALAEAMRGQGQLAASEPLLRRALSLQRSDLRTAPRQIDHTLNMLALSLRDQGRLAEAELLLEQALEISRRDAAVHPIGLHRTLTNLAHVLLAQRRFAEAEQLYRDVLSRRLAYWGPQHPEVANALINLGSALGWQSDFDEAQRIFTDGLAMRRQTQGHEHAEVGIDLAGLAGIYHRHGHVDRAAATYQDALVIQRATLGDQHPITRATAGSLEAVLRALGNR